jgi:phosphoserine phosphatase
VVGDGANDLGMIRGRRPRRRLSRQARGRGRRAARIDHGDLTALLYAQGYRRDEFVGDNP